MTTVVLSVPRVVDHPRVGGHFWEYMQYAYGLRRVGVDVWWMERVSPDGDPSHGVVEDLDLRINTFLERIRRFGFDDRLILYQAEGHATGLKWEPINMPRHHAASIIRGADLLVNFDYRIEAELVACFRRSALVDIDPGLLQFWIHHGQLSVAPHDVYLTTGETVGTPGAHFPDCGLTWAKIRPALAHELWPYCADAACTTFTTVSSWWGDEWIWDGSEYYENNKRVTFNEFWELPRRSGKRMELALYLGPGDRDDVVRLQEGGWHVRPSSEVAATPLTYQAYVQRSRGEFSCVKPSCIRFQNAWVSDRTLCYLASGKPAVVQDTGPSAVLPSGEGLFRFSTMEEAVAALQEVDSRYDHHCRAARELVQAHFDAEEVAHRILDVALDRVPMARAHSMAEASHGRGK